jgi:hypothetical protein
MLTSQTYFEQIPLEVVRKIAEKQREESDAKSGAPGAKTPAAKTEMTGDQNGHALQYPVWQKLCQEALVELDSEKLKELIAEAEAAVFLRLQELVISSDGQAERQALLDVSSSLRFLKRDVLRYPDWESGSRFSGSQAGQ